MSGTKIIRPEISAQKLLAINLISLQIHSPAPRCGTIASVAFILWRVKQAANKQCWLASMCKYSCRATTVIIIAAVKGESQ
jgi:hypothetical protein